MQRHELERLSREELIAHAERLNVPRPRVLTQPELIDEIIARTAKTDRERARSRGWLGKARDLLARVIEQGLHLPDAARAIRTSPSAARSWPTPPPPLPTVTLAEIYAAQGHLERAVSVLDEVIAREPDHKEARELRERFVEQTQRTRARPPRAADVPAGRAETGGEAAAPQRAAEPQEEAPIQAFAEADEPEAPAEEVKASSVDTIEDTRTNRPEAAEAAEVSTPEAAAEASATSPEIAGEVHAGGPEVAGEEPAAAEQAVLATPVPALAEEAEPARETLTAAAEDEGAGPVTERDAKAQPVAEATADKGAAANDAAANDAAANDAAASESAAAKEGAPEAPDEIEETVVDGEAIAELADRLRAQAEPAKEEPEEDELPEHYDVDEVVAIAVDPETIYVYWEIRAVTLARALSRRPGGRLALRIAAVTPSWDGPITRTWELHIDALFGDRFVRDIPQGANVRVSVGWLDGDAFEPFAIGAEVASPRLAPAEVEATEVGHWAPEAGSPAAPGPLNRAPRAYRMPGSWATGPGRSQGGADAAASAPASPMPLGSGQPAPGLTALAPRGGTGPGINRATRSAELARSYFRSVAGSYIRGGGSELVRGGASDLVRGGASDLAWGGASDLVRARNY